MAAVKDSKHPPAAVGSVAAQVDPEVYTVSSAIMASGIGRTKLYEELNSGRLRSFVHCGRRLILREDLRHWLEAARDAYECGE